MCAWQRAKCINDICVAFVALYMPLQYVATTDANWPEKKDQVVYTT